MDSSSGVSEKLGSSLRSAVAARMLGHLRPELAVTLGTEVVAAGFELPPAIALAIQPSDPSKLRREDVWEAFDDLCRELTINVDSQAQAGWIYARDISHAILDRTLAPDAGANHLWPLWQIIGEVPGSNPLDMLQLYEAWQASVGDARVHAEREIRTSAGSVVKDAKAALAAMSLTLGFDGSNIRPEDVMPLFLRTCPTFLRTWYEVMTDHHDAEQPGGRLNYLDAGSAAKHLVGIYQDNNREFVKAGFQVIEQMHNSNDEYVQELATIGFLEGIQNSAHRAGIDPALFEEFMGPVSRTWWRGL